MLNHIWLALIIVGILTAAGRDIYDASRNSYGNGIAWEGTIDAGPADVHAKELRTPVTFSAAQLRAHFPDYADSSPATFDATLLRHDGAPGSIMLDMTEKHPGPFGTMRDAQGGKERLIGSFARTSDSTLIVRFDPTLFVYMKRITQAAFDAAGAAVQIAIGLIGIMALWLGMMKIAEAAGLVTLIARAVRPLTIRLFPDIPADHPAVAAMLMNISANMLGLGNAATPFGLKAMEELNKLNPKAGVATNSMCTFLAMNTSCITLIPATAIAVRAASGSANPAIIIGTTVLASLTATIVGVTMAKLLQRVRMFRWERIEGAQ
jgi:spore maturation protein A